MIQFPEYFPLDAVRPEDGAALERKIHALVQAMTTEEKLSFCAGGENPPVPGKIANAGYMGGVPRLGVPELRMFDGPAGTTYTKPTTCLPAQGAMACAWSPELAYDYGRVIGAENAAVSGNCQLGAQFDVVRTPHFERTKDMMGEDPVLQAALAAAVSSGMADQGVIPVGKHFAACVRSCCPAFEPDFRVDEQTLHQMYLRPFEAAVKQGRCTALMTAYNMLNGAWASGSSYLNQQVLRKMWGFQGFTITDWGANHSFSLGQGTDIEMPAPEYNSPAQILAAIGSGALDASVLDAAVGHVLWAMGRAGYLSLVQLENDGTVQQEPGRTAPIRMRNRYDEIAGEMLRAHGETALEICRKSAVLLKNENEFLPLRAEDYTGGNTVAVIGMAAGRLISGESQERAFGDLDQMASPLAELRRLSGNPAGFQYSPGVDLIGEKIPAAYLFIDAKCTEHGLARTYGVSQADGQGANMFGPGGAGQEYVGGQSQQELANDTDGIPVPAGIWQNNAGGAMEGHALGEPFGVDLEVNFTCGTIDGHVNGTYRNSSDGNALPFGSIYTWRGFLRAPESGEYELLLHAIGGIAGFKISLDGGSTWEIAGDTTTREGAHWGWSRILSTEEGMDICGRRFTLEAGRAYPVLVYCNGKIPDKDVQLRIAWITPSMRKQHYSRALELAASCKKVLVFVHRESGACASNMMEPLQELGSFGLPEEQETLLEDICRAAKEHGNRLAVVMHCSSAFVLGPWADQAEALLDMWMPGQRGGTAGAELLLGLVNPSGKTTQSFPLREQDTPLTDTRAHYETRYRGRMTGKRRVRVDFTEGIFTGYRWHDREQIAPRFCFGHGLSYTEFSYADASVREDDGEMTVSLSVTNRGDRIGSEIVQVYVGPAEVPAHIQMPEKQLAGFCRLEDIRPGETVQAEIPLDRHALEYWDPEAPLTQRADGTWDKWVRPAGSRTLLIGASAEKIQITIVTG